MKRASEAEGRIFRPAVQSPGDDQPQGLRHQVDADRGGRDALAVQVDNVLPVELDVEVRPSHMGDELGVVVGETLGVLADAAGKGQEGNLLYNINIQ